MATLSDLKEVKEALDAGLVSQAEYDAVKRDYLRAKLKAIELQTKELRAKEEALEARKEFQKKELRAKEEALEFQKKSISECQKMELRLRMEACEADREFQKRELIAKEALHKKELRTREEALWANREFLKRELIAKVAFHKKELRAKKEAIEANKEFQKQELLAKEEFQQKRSEADLRAFALESIVKHGSSIMSEEQKVGLVRDYAKMSGLDGSAENHARASKRQRVSTEERAASPPQPSTPPAPPAAAVPPPADAPAAVVASQGTAPAPRPSKRIRSMSALVKEEAAAATSEDSGTTICDSEDDSDSDDPITGKRCQKKWTKDDDEALVAALRAGQSIKSIRIGGRAAGTAYARLRHAKQRGKGGPALREYLEETCPEYMCNPSHRQRTDGWSAEEDQAFIRAHREGKTMREIAAMLPGRSEGAVGSRWQNAKKGKIFSAALREYVAEITPSEKFGPWSVEEDQTFIRAHKEGKTPLEIAALLPGRTNTAVSGRWNMAKNGRYGSAALRAYAAKCRKD